MTACDIYLYYMFPDIYILIWTDNMINLLSNVQYSTQVKKNGYLVSQKSKRIFRKWESRIYFSLLQRDILLELQRPELSLHEKIVTFNCSASTGWGRGRGRGAGCNPPGACSRISLSMGPPPPSVRGRIWGGSWWRPPCRPEGWGFRGIWWSLGLSPRVELKQFPILILRNRNSF